MIAGALAAGAIYANPCTPTKQATWYQGRLAFTIDMCDVTDLDQIREQTIFVDGLPNNGNYYCVPTATMNWFAYIANHGLPTLAPGAGPYGPENCGSISGCPQYNKITNALFKLGVLMDTDPQKGTGSIVKGANTWLAQNGLLGLVVASEYGATKDKSPRVIDMMAAAFNGDLVIPVFGMYKPFEKLSIDDQYWVLTHLSGSTLSGLWRYGGHAVSLRSGSAGFDSFYSSIKFSDPVASDSTIAQSAFASSGGPTKEVFEYFNGNMREQSHLVDYAGGKGYFDGYGAIRSVFTLTTTENTAHLFTAIDLSGGTGKTMKSYSIGGKVLDIAVHPENDQHAYIVAGTAGVTRLDGTGRGTRMVVTPSGPRKLVFGDTDETLFVLTANELVGISSDDVITRRSSLRVPLDAIAYDFKQMRLVGISLAAQRLFAFNSQLETVADTAIQQPLCTSSYHLKYNPKTGGLAGFCDGSVRVSEFDWNGPSARQVERTLMGLRSPVGLAINDQGHFFTGDNGLLVELDDQFQPVGESAWARVPSTGPFDILHSYRSYDPRLVDSPLMRNVLPTDDLAPITPGGR
jgi:hypothetical protein